MVTVQQVEEYFTYDTINGNLVRKKVHPFSLCKIGDIAGYNVDGYIKTYFKGTNYANHQLVWLLHYGYLPKLIDHKNGIRSDNRIKNLRECTHFENNQNRKNKQSNNSTGYMGVSVHKGRYRAVININKKHTHIGYFDTAEDAFNAYMSVKRKNHSLIEN